MKSIYWRILWCCCLLNTAQADWFETLKSTASDRQLYEVLYAMPKGGDLHNHLSGSGFPQWWYDAAIAAGEQGYRYYTKVRINNCREYGTDQYGRDPYFILFITRLEHHYQKLSDCERSEYVELSKLDDQQKQGWLNSIKLDKAHEGRNEFFETHWTRLGDLTSNHYIVYDILLKNMQAFGQEGLIYLETDLNFNSTNAQGQLIPPDDVMNFYRQQLASTAAKATGVTVRFHIMVLRFADDAEQVMRQVYQRVHYNRDLFVGIDMAGREDNDKGYPLRFLPVLRDLRKKYPGIHLSIHAGEVDEPNQHIKDTLLLGATRIGHGFNLLTDPDTFLLMRHGPYLVETNLISNLLLEYVDDYAEHPFPEFLRTGVPVALSTDDRGMWDSNMTDEFFVAVKEFNLSWSEVKQLSRNSLEYSFADEQTKTRLLNTFDKRITSFEKRMQKDTSKLKTQARSHGFLCRQYQLCEW